MRRSQAHLPESQPVLHVPLQAVGPEGQVVAVKAMSVRGMSGWKQLELFEREAQLLRGLAHPGIPKYVDYLEEDTLTDRGFFLVQACSPSSTFCKGRRTPARQKHVPEGL